MAGVCVVKFGAQSQSSSSSSQVYGHSSFLKMQLYFSCIAGRQLAPGRLVEMVSMTGLAMELCAGEGVPRLNGRAVRNKSRRHKKMDK